MLFHKGGFPSPTSLSRRVFLAGQAMWLAVAADCMATLEHDALVPLDGIEDDPCAVLASAKDSNETVAALPANLADEDAMARWSAERKAGVDGGVKLSAKLARSGGAIVDCVPTETRGHGCEGLALKLVSLPNS